MNSYGDTDEYGKEQLKMTVITEKGEVLEYIFYHHSATNSFYTLNGSGRFYVEREKLLEVRSMFEALVPKS